MKSIAEMWAILKSSYSNKEAHAITAFYGEIEHLKILNDDLKEFFDQNGSDFAKFNSDQIIEAEFRISMLFSFFHVCLEYKKRSAFKSGIKKTHPKLEKYLAEFNAEMYSKLRIYRNKTFHENASLIEDFKAKKKLNPAQKFNEIYLKIISFIEAANG